MELQVKVLQQACHYEVDHANQEDDNRYLVDTVHHPDIEVGRTGGIFLAEEITTHLSEGEEGLQPAFFSGMIWLLCLHNIA